MGSQQPNRGGGLVGTGQYIGRTKWARAYYDFSKDGGAIGALTLRGDAIPNGAIVLSTLIDVRANVTSGGAATVAIGVESATDVRGVVAYNSAPLLSTTGTLNGAITRNTAPGVTTADRSVVATIATAALTAGRFTVLVEYIELSSNT